MLLTFSLVSLIKVSTVGKRPVLIEITESSGNIVTQEFNVFSDIEGVSLSTSIIEGLKSLSEFSHLQLSIDLFCSGDKAGGSGPHRQ